jgi:hypothetical protein
MPERQELEAAFRGAVEGEVRFDAYSRVLYSTDASAWQIEPIGAVIPRIPSNRHPGWNSSIQFTRSIQEMG